MLYGIWAGIIHVRLMGWWQDNTGSLQKNYSSNWSGEVKHSGPISPSSSPRHPYLLLLDFKNYQLPFSLYHSGPNSPSSPPSCPHRLLLDLFPTAMSSSSFERLLHCQYQDEFSTCYAGFIFFFPLSRIDFIFKSEITRWEANLISW